MREEESDAECKGAGKGNGDRRRAVSTEINNCIKIK